VPWPLSHKHSMTSSFALNIPSVGCSPCNACDVTVVARCRRSTGVCGNDCRRFDDSHVIGQTAGRAASSVGVAADRRLSRALGQLVRQRVVARRFVERVARVAVLQRRQARRSTWVSFRVQRRFCFCLNITLDFDRFARSETGSGARIVVVAATTDLRRRRYRQRIIAINKRRRFDCVDVAVRRARRRRLLLRRCRRHKQRAGRRRDDCQRAQRR
jgi:hypothetical protein